MISTSVFRLNILLLLNLWVVSGDVSVKDEQHLLEMTQNLNLARQDRIQDVCERYPPKVGLDELPQNELDHIIVDDERKLLYCYVPKVSLNLR